MAFKKSGSSDVVKSAYDLELYVVYWTVYIDDASSPNAPLIYLSFYDKGPYKEQKTI